MTDPRKAEDRDSVLFAFHQECERPTAEQIIAWTKRFPEFADDIHDHATVAWDWAMHAVPSGEGVSAETIHQWFEREFPSCNPTGMLEYFFAMRVAEAYARSLLEANAALQAQNEQLEKDWDTDAESLERTIVALRTKHDTAIDTLMKIADIVRLILSRIAHRRKCAMADSTFWRELAVQFRDLPRTSGPARYQRAVELLELVHAKVIRADGACWICKSLTVEHRDDCVIGAVEKFLRDDDQQGGNSTEGATK